MNVLLKAQQPVKLSTASTYCSSEIYLVNIEDNFWPALFQYLKLRGGKQGQSCVKIEIEACDELTLASSRKIEISNRKIDM